MDRSPAPGTTDGARVVAGRYTLLAPLGSGGMGTVWRARDGVLGREVAVKEVVFPHGLADQDRDVLRERTRREARAAARLDHPSAVTVYDVVEEGGVPYLVMELVEARTLADVVRRDGPLSPARAGEVGLAVLGALQAAHRQGIVHRDVKPGNVLLCTDDDTGMRRVVLTDFGIATSSGDASITSTGLLLGSPSYIAPERARGKSPGPSSDLWSLGATLFTAVEGRPPYDAGDPVATVTAVVTGEHAPFVAAGPLEPVITGLLERDPQQRLDADSARVMLEQVVRGADAGPPPAARPAARLAPVQRAGRTTAMDAQAVRNGVAQAEDPAPTARPGLARPAPPRSGRRRAALPALLAAVVFLLVTVGGGLALLTGGSPGGDPGTAAPSPTAPADEPTDGPTGTGAPEEPDGERPDGVPADWVAWTHPDEGWTLFHPSSYEVSSRNGLTQFRDESTRFTLRVDGDVAGDSPLAVEQQVAAAFADALGGFTQIRLEPVDGPGEEAAELEFTYSDSGADLRALHRAFVADGRTYTLWWQTTADRFEESRAEFERLAGALVPA